MDREIEIRPQKEIEDALLIVGILLRTKEQMNQEKEKWALIIADTLLWVAGQDDGQFAQFLKRATPNLEIIKQLAKDQHEQKETSE